MQHSLHKGSTRSGSGSSINDIMVLGGRDQGFCDDISKALVMECMMMGGGGSKIVQNCVASFMDDPFLSFQP